MRFVNKTKKCWLWTGATYKGYGQFQLGTGKTVRAHRFAYEMWVGEIPPGLTIDHECKVRNCVRPSHLRPMERGANALAGNGPAAKNKRKTECLRGHRLVGRNVIVRPGRSGRECRECANARRRVREI